MVFGGRELFNFEVRRIIDALNTNGRDMKEQVKWRGSKENTTSYSQLTYKVAFALLKSVDVIVYPIYIQNH